MRFKGRSSRAMGTPSQKQQEPVSKQKYFENFHRTYSCIHCRAHLANHDELISKLFQGNHGRAYLFDKVVNVGCKKAVERELLTGLHAVADIYCDNCATTIGWKYEQAFVPSQKYKEGKYIIELVHMLKENSWDLTSYNVKKTLIESEREQSREVKNDNGFSNGESCKSTTGPRREGNRSLTNSATTLSVSQCANEPEASNGGIGNHQAITTSRTTIDFQSPAHQQTQNTSSSNGHGWAANSQNDKTPSKILNSQRCPKSEPDGLELLDRSLGFIQLGGQPAGEQLSNMSCPSPSTSSSSSSSPPVSQPPPPPSSSSQTHSNWPKDSLCSTRSPSYMGPSASANDEES